MAWYEIVTIITFIIAVLDWFSIKPRRLIQSLIEKKTTVFYWTYFTIILILTLYFIFISIYLPLLGVFNIEFALVLTITAVFVVGMWLPILQKQKFWRDSHEKLTLWIGRLLIVAILVWYWFISFPDYLIPLILTSILIIVVFINSILKHKKNEVNTPKVRWWCGQCKSELESKHIGPCPKCGNTRKYCTVVENPIKRAIIKYLDKYAIRSFLQLLVHVVIAIGLAILLYFLIDSSRVIIQSSNFVTIMSSIAAASGALLAISLAFATFMSRFADDWRERIIERLQKQREKLAFQMRLSAWYYPDISRALVDLYELCAFYISGQSIEQETIDKASYKFHDWANPQMIASSKSGRTIDFGNPTHYDTYEKHMFDAHILCTDLTFSLTELSLAERFGRSLFTHPPLITGWALILVFSLVFAFIGSMGVLCAVFHLPLLFIPIYLSLFAIIALILDFRASIGHIRGRETGYEMAMTGFTGKSPFLKSDK